MTSLLVLAEQQHPSPLPALVLPPFGPTDQGGWTLIAELVVGGAVLARASLGHE